jgi:hypothetical protein
MFVYRGFNATGNKKTPRSSIRTLTACQNKIPAISQDPAFPAPGFNIDQREYVSESRPKREDTYKDAPALFR